jgi:hypothetical protein
VLRKLHRKKLKESGKYLKPRSLLAKNMKLISLLNSKGLKPRELDWSMKPSRREFAERKRQRRRGSDLNTRLSKKESESNMRQSN